MKKKSKADLLRSFAIPEERVRMGTSWLRYKNPLEKGIYWYYFSLFVRMRDVEKYGTCISCGRIIDVETSNAGHFMPAEDCGRDLLFDERNVNAECAHCNAWDSTHLLGYAEGLDERYGDGTAERLRERRENYLKSSDVVKDWNRVQYEEKVRELIKHSEMTLGKQNHGKKLGTIA